MIILNLTIPPILVLILAPGAFANISMPAPNASAIAAFSAGGAPLPALAYGGRIYVLQDGAPAYVEYVPAYINSSGVYEISLNLDQPAVVIIPPGIMPQDMPRYRLIAVNKTGIYAEVEPGDVRISYYVIGVQLASAAQTVAATQTTTTSSAGQTSAAGGSALGPTWALGAALVVVIVAAVFVLLRRR